MAYAINAATYSNTELNDTLSGSPDYWTNVSGATHSYASSQLTMEDNAGGASEQVTSNVGSIAATQRYYRFTWKYTADNNSTPIVFAAVDGSNNVSVGMYMNFPTDTLFARNGAGWTSTGVTLATNTTQEVEYVINRTAGTYVLYINGSSIGTYTIDTNTDAGFSIMSFGGGTTSATWTYVISDVFLAKDTIAVATSFPDLRLAFL